MKRKNECLIEIIDDTNNIIESENTHKKIKMPSPSEWLQSLKDAEKTSILQEKIQKVHYKFTDSSEMVEEYNVDTSCVLRRAWKKPGKLGGEGKWEVEVGDPEVFDRNENPCESIQESNDTPTIARRNTRKNLEWRIRNLPYPIETYSVAADASEKCIIVRTTNKKYFKKLSIPELERIGILPVQKNIEFTHKFGTLIITYKKPNELLELEAAWLIELKKVKSTSDSVGDCKPS